MEAIILCGIQASGKSSYARRTWFDSHVRINLDMLHTRQREDILLYACLAAKARFVVDNTNPQRVQRVRYLQLARAAGYPSVLLYFFPTDLEAALQRNAARVGKQRVPDIAICGTAKKLELPDSGEGWDQMFVVRALPDGGFASEACPS